MQIQNIPFAYCTVTNMPALILARSVRPLSSRISTPLRQKCRIVAVHEMETTNLLEVQFTCSDPVLEYLVIRYRWSIVRCKNWYIMERKIPRIGKRSIRKIRTGTRYFEAMGCYRLRTYFELQWHRSELAIRVVLDTELMLRQGSSMYLP